MQIYDNIAATVKAIARVNNLRTSYKRVWNTPEGREVLMDIIKVSGIGAFEVSTQDSMATGISVGRMKIGEHVLTNIQADLLSEDMSELYNPHGE